MSVVFKRFQVYQRLVNEYSIIGPNGNTIKSPELLARYCDVLLRKGSVHFLLKQF
jgi:hypothetical protein